MAAIEVERSIEGSSRQTPCRVVIDGQTRGNVAAGEIQIFRVEPGVHTVRLVLNDNEPAPVKVIVNGGITRLTCRTRTRRALGLSLGMPVTSVEVREEWETLPPRPVARRPVAPRLVLTPAE